MCVSDTLAAPQGGAPLRCAGQLSPELQKIWGMSEYCWCMKAVYCLPSAPRAWFKHVTAFLVGKCHMRILKQDEAIAILRDKHGKYLRICMYVDDFAVFSNSRELYNECRDAYFGQDGFEGEEGPLDYMPGVNFDVDFEKQSIKLSGTSSINKVLERYGKPQRGSKVPMLETDADLRYAELPAEGSAEQLALRERAARYLYHPFFTLQLHVVRTSVSRLGYCAGAYPTLRCGTWRQLRPYWLTLWIPVKSASNTSTPETLVDYRSCTLR